MSVVDKPLVSYMLSKKNEPDSDELIKKIGEQITETTSSILGFSGILSSISALSETKRKVETKQEQKNEKITSTKTQYFEKSKEAYEDYDDENDDYDSYDSYSSYVYHEKKQSVDNSPCIRAIVIGLRAGRRYLVRNVAGNQASLQRNAGRQSHSQCNRGQRHQQTGSQQ